MDKLTQEALSRRYSEKVIMILPLEAGGFAVFNNARELCGFTDHLDGKIAETWFPPKPPPLREEYLRQAADADEILKAAGL